MTVSRPDGVEVVPPSSDVLSPAGSTMGVSV